MQEVHYILRSLGHIVSQHIFCIVRISHQLGLLQTQGQNPFQNFLVIIGISMIAHAGISLIDILTHLTVLRILQNRQTA